MNITYHNNESGNTRQVSKHFKPHIIHTPNW